jgi:hypothetical protein
VFSHAQSTFINTLKNLAQIYLLDRRLHRNANRINALTRDNGKFIELKSQHDISKFVESFPSA